MTRRVPCRLKAPARWRGTSRSLARLSSGGLVSRAPEEGVKRPSISAAALWVAIATLAAPAERAGGAARPPPAVAELLEDNAATLLPQLTNPTGDPGEGHVEHADVFSGKSAVRIVPLQRFQPHIPGWNYRIVEKPRPGEFRYVRW